MSENLVLKTRTVIRTNNINSVTISIKVILKYDKELFKFYFLHVSAVSKISTMNTYCFFKKNLKTNVL